MSEDQMVYRLTDEGEPVLVGYWRAHEDEALEDYLRAREADERDRATYVRATGVHWLVTGERPMPPVEREQGLLARLLGWWRRG